MRFPGKWAALAAAAMLAACTSQKEPAEAAVARVDTSLNELRTDAQQYATEQLQAVDASVKRLKDKLASQDYGDVVQGAPAVASEVEALKTMVANAKADAEAMQAAAQAEWNELTASVPPMVKKLQARVDQLARTRKYPKGMDKAAFDTARSGFESLKTEWTEATAEFGSGHGPDAVRKARSAKTRAELLLAQLDVPV